MLSSVGQLSNGELLTRVKSLAADERQATAALIAHLAELEERRLYLAEGCSSLFTYCTEVLHLSEHAAYGRIEAARLLRRFPVLLERLEEGSLNLTTVCLLGAHLTSENHRELLAMARQKSKRQVQELVARLCPQPPVSASVRRLPTVRQTAVAAVPSQDDSAAREGIVTMTRSGPSSVAPRPDLSSPASTPSPARPVLVTPLAPQRYRVQFTASAETIEKLRRAQALLRHQIPDGDPAAILDRALSVLLETLAKQRLAAAARPRAGRGTVPGSRHIPAAVKRAVWVRDAGRCAFVSHKGRRCTEEGFLEFHHVAPYAAGGEATTDNIQLRCRSHNGYEAELYFGPRTVLVTTARAGPNWPSESGQNPRGATIPNTRIIGSCPWSPRSTQ
ncbi:MAG: HNH endonuclease [bacterium]